MLHTGCEALISAMRAKTGNSHPAKQPFVGLASCLPSCILLLRIHARLWKGASVSRRCVSYFRACSSVKSGDRHRFCAQQQGDLTLVFVSVTTHFLLLISFLQR